MTPPLLLHFAPAILTGALNILDDVTPNTRVLASEQ